MTRRPQDLVFTLFGEFLLREAGPVRVGSLIALLEPLGLGSGVVRTTLSRMVARGWLAVERVGRRGCYALSERGRQLLEEGEARIYRPEHGSAWDGEWTLVAYSIPEEQRRIRERLRARLSWLGLGSLGNGLWLSPHDLVDRVRQVGAELGITGNLEVFRGRYAGPGGRRLVGQCWQLPGLNDRYVAFIERHLESCRSARSKRVSPQAAYVARFELVHEYREFPLLDPFLPEALQPAGWAGGCALALFQSYRELLVSPSEAHVRSVLGSGVPAASGAV